VCVYNSFRYHLYHSDPGIVKDIDVLLVDAVRSVLWFSETGEVIFCEQGRAVSQDFSKYEAYCRLGVKIRDTVKAQVNENVIDKHLTLSNDCWAKLRDFVEAQDSFRSSKKFAEGNRPEILNKLFCIIAHDTVAKNARGRGNADLLSYKSFKFFSSLFAGGESFVVEALQRIRAELDIV